MGFRIVFNLPWPPSVNRYWRHIGIQSASGVRVQTLISRAGREYAVKVADALKSQGLKDKICIPVSMHIDLYPPDNRRRDVDNHAKAVLDSLVKAGLLEDDSLVKDLRIVMVGPLKTVGGAVEVTVEPCPAKKNLQLTGQE